MSEWGVVSVIIALVGLVATVAGPIVRLNSTINELSGQLKLLLSNLEDFKARYTQSLAELRAADAKMEKELLGHESRISRLEATAGEHHQEG